MALGDEAIAAGMDVLSPTTDLVKDGADEITRTRDYIAQRTSAVTPVEKGGTGATTVAGARNALGLGNTSGALPIANGGTGATSAADARNALDVFNKVNTVQGGPGNQIKILRDGATLNLGVNIDSTFLGHMAIRGETWTGAFNGGSITSLDARTRTITSSYASIYADGSGVFGIPSSSRDAKTDLTEWSDEQSDRFLSLVTAYRGRYVTDAPDSPLRPFLILEEFIAAGFPEFVIYDDQGNGISLHYELVTVALIALAGRQDRRLTQVEARLGALEGHAA